MKSSRRRVDRPASAIKMPAYNSTEVMDDMFSATAEKLAVIPQDFLLICTKAQEQPSGLTHLNIFKTWVMNTQNNLSLQIRLISF